MFCPAMQLGHSKARPLLGLLQGNLDKITERRAMEASWDESDNIGTN